MKTLAKNVHREVSKLCHSMAEKSQRGYAQAAWFEENGIAQVEEKLGKESFLDWIKKAESLGYSVSEIIVTPYTSTHGVWFEWVSFSLEIPIYGEYPHSFEKIIFPANSELPKTFVVPFLEREQKEAAEKKAEREAEEEAERAKRAAEKAAYENDRREWILSHGSQYLKDCLELGIKANLEYIVERAAMEFPGYTVDYADSASWGEKVSPSEEAIAELKELRAKGYRAEIIWLKSPAEVRKGDYEFTDDDDYDGYGNFDFAPREAIVIRGYLGTYDLVKEF